MSWCWMAGFRRGGFDRHHANVPSNKRLKMKTINFCLATLPMLDYIMDTRLEQHNILGTEDSHDEKDETRQLIQGKLSRHFDAQFGEWVRMNIRRGCQHNATDENLGVRRQIRALAFQFVNKLSGRLDWSYYKARSVA